METVQIISTEELQRRLEGGAVSEFWNVLTDDYYTGELIPGSRRVPLDTVGREAARVPVAKDAGLIVYCSGPTCPQSRAAAEKLVALGYTTVRLYEGGLEAWKDAGLRVERPAGEPSRV